MYIELHAASAFSFLRGASLPETLMERAAALGYPALALLDADGVYGAPRFHKAAKQLGLRAIIGAELTVDSGLVAAGSGLDSRLATITNAVAMGRGRKRGSPQSRTAEPSNPRAADRVASPAHRWRLPVLVESAQGYRNLCRLVT